MINTRTNLLEVKPLRNLTFMHLWALGVGSVIGDGIFVMIGEGIATAGPSSIIAYFIAGTFQMCLMISLGELAVGMPSAGSMAVWVERVMGEWWGFLSGLLFVAGWLFAGGSVSLALGKVTTWFFPHLPADKWTIIFAILFLTVFALLNILGGLIAARVQFYLTVILVGIMACFTILGLPKIDFSNFTPMFPTGVKMFPYTISLGVYAYIGAVSLTTAGDECKNPADLPKALVWSSITFLVLYTLAHTVAVGVVPWAEIDMSISPFTLAASRIFGYAGAFILNIGAWLAAATCIHMGTIYAASRILYYQSLQGYLPGFFGYLHPKTRTPIYGILFTWVISVGLILLSVINPDLVYIHLATQLVLTWSISWGLAAIAGILYRKKYPDEIDSLSWRQPLYPLFTILGIVGIGIVFFGTFLGTPTSIAYSLLLSFLIFIFFKYYSIPNMKRTKNPCK